MLASASASAWHAMEVGQFAIAAPLDSPDARTQYIGIGASGCRCWSVASVASKDLSNQRRLLARRGPISVKGGRDDPLARARGLAPLGSAVGRLHRSAVWEQAGIEQLDVRSSGGDGCCRLVVDDLSVVERR